MKNAERRMKNEERSPKFSQFFILRSAFFIHLLNAKAAGQCPPLSTHRTTRNYAGLLFASPALALSASALNAAASRTAMSARTLRSRVLPAAFRPLMNCE